MVSHEEYNVLAMVAEALIDMSHTINGNLIDAEPIREALAAMKKKRFDLLCNRDIGDWEQRLIVKTARVVTKFAIGGDTDEIRKILKAVTLDPPSSPSPTPGQ